MTIADHPLRRLPDWPSRLTAHLAEARSRAFAWGDFDCCLFVADGLLAMSGEDLAAGLRGGYSDKLSAYRLVKQEGGAGLEELADKIFLAAGGASVGPLYARRGDPVLVETESGPALGLVDLSGYRVAVAAPSGFLLLPLSEGRRAWRVG